MQVIPYLDFGGRCEEALEFYKVALGAKIESIMRYSENPEPQYNPPGSENKVMHACFCIDDSTVMASDGCGSGLARFEGISLAAQTPSIADAERIFAALSEGGNVQMPLTETFFSKRFGMLDDKFGVSWMVNVAQQ
jgi:PhnB protein